MKRVGIYSGSFDPIHEGHVAFAVSALKQCRLDKIFFLVEPRPRRKQGVKAFEHRSAMVRLALKPYPKLGSIILHQQRFSVEGTMPLLQARFKGAELYMLMGDDFFAHLSRWPHLESLVGTVQLVIGLRHYTVNDVQKHIVAIEQSKGVHFDYQTVASPSPTFSSSTIRAQIKRGTVPKGMDPKVLTYIAARGLYVSSPKS